MANECYILMLIYLDRISQTNSAFCITALNAHRLIVTGLVLVCVISPFPPPSSFSPPLVLFKPCRHFLIQLGIPQLPSLHNLSRERT